MKTKKLLFLLLALALLMGCIPTPEPPPPPPPVVEAPEPLPEPEPPAPVWEPIGLPEPEPLYLYNGGKNVALDGQGNILLETQNDLSYVTDRYRETVGFAVSHYEGKTMGSDGYPCPERRWMDIYDLEGNLRLTDIQGERPELYGGLLETMTEKGQKLLFHLYRASDGQPLYENLWRAWDLRETVYIQRREDDPGLILDLEGNVLAELPPETKVTSFDVDGGTGYLEIRGGSGYGLLDARGQSVLDCVYQEGYGVSYGCALMEKNGEYLAIDLKTGETAPLQTDSIPTLLPGAAIVGDGRSRDRLVDWDGNDLLGEAFSYLHAMEDWETGELRLLYGGYEDGEGKSWTVGYGPDGTELWRIETTGADLQLCNEKWGLLRRDRSYAGVYLETGAVLPIQTPENSYIEFVYGRTDDPFLRLYYQNPQGWGRCGIAALDGTVLLEDLEDWHCYYLGGGVVECRKGFDRGLLRLDGTWLYKERAFDDWNEE